MSNLQAVRQPAPDDRFASSRQNVKLIYILYLVGCLFYILALVGFILTLVGLIFAYLNRSQAPLWLQSHYTYQIRTFWFCLLFTLIAPLLGLVLLVFSLAFTSALSIFIVLIYISFIYLVILIWYIVRCVKGLQAVARNEPILRHYYKTRNVR